MQLLSSLSVLSFTVVQQKEALEKETKLSILEAGVTDVSTVTVSVIAMTT